MLLTDRHVLITGGAGGIGIVLAKRLLDLGNLVTVCSRSIERLDEAAATTPGLRTIRCDVSDLDSVGEMGDQLEAGDRPVDILINNAALNKPLSMHDDDAPDKIGDEVAVNIMGTINVTWRLLPMLEQQPDSCVAIVTSGIAYAPAVGVPGYSLTKAALQSFTRSLRMAMRNTSVRVVEIVPPAVDTDMIRALNCKKMAPDSVADAVIGGLTKNRAEIRMGQTHLTYALSRLWPRAAERLINGSFD
jgi:uncharacterized oxidoreductase